MDRANENQEIPAQAPRRGCFTRFLTVGLMCVAIVLAFCLYLISQPQDLTDVQGYLKSTRDPLRHDFRQYLKSFHDRNYPVTLSEREINTWLAEVIKPRQEGLLGRDGLVTLDGVWVRLLDGKAEVILERKIAGRPFTVSIFVQIAQSEDTDGIKTEVKLHGGPYSDILPFPTVGGRFGQLKVPQGFLPLVMPSFRKLADACTDEIRLGFEDMARISIEKGKIKLDPRVPTHTIDSPPPR